MLKYGDYHSNPELIADFDLNILFKLYEETMGTISDDPLLIRDQIRRLLAYSDSFAGEFVAATDIVLLRERNDN